MNKIKKVLCIVDSYEWALANRARALKKHLKSECDIDIIFFKDKNFNKINFNLYDIVYVLNWPIHGYIHKKISKNRKYRLITSVSSHIGQPNDKSFLSLLKNYDAVSLSNKILYKDFKRRFPSLKLYYTPFGVDTDTFYRITDPSKYPKVFGWVGNHTRPVKRFKEIEQIFLSLKKEGIKFKVITQSSGLNRKQMAEYYNTIGTLVCFSTSEGTPNPVLEAAACGRNIISTYVGNVPELIQGKGIITVTNKEELKSVIKMYASNPKLIKNNGDALLSEANRVWKWENKAYDFRRFLGLIK